MEAFEVFRYERKYVVSESAAAAIRRFVTAYLQLDAHMAGKESTGYPLYSLYFDTPQFALYRHSMEGLKNRYKLRIRFYDEAPDSPAFLEIKKRTTETIHKLRAAVTKPAAERLLGGARLSSADLLSSGDAAVRALTEFSDRRERLGAEGTAFVGYRREAYVSHAAEGARVTFDRQIVGYSYSYGCGLAIPEQEAPVAAKGVVLELKYNGRIPQWMHDLIASFRLQSVSYPKYVHCLDALQMAPERAGVLARSVR